MSLDALRARYPGAQTFTFGDGKALTDQLNALVRSGAKRATCGALRDYESGAEAMPTVGRRDIALEHDGMPAFVIETRELRTCRFDEVSEEMALAEGEDDDLAGWRAGHEAYFTRNGGFAPDMMLVWERFDLIEDLAATEETTITGERP
ncbi:ASCH domain-containing protein [Roseobacter sp. HKCCA0434]|uniref:ASCH domain-containing protein n=1 Tax=Roseobacter sp. HKCCA0434 TaxID=3079297 RepID=UPI002905B66C|nr:ASCH domain-containing protein [Roseobacter sp. HKCCA0434]